jgi:ABC-type cobalamin/Fe3+-siderophores transport system ATPase subunit
MDRPKTDIPKLVAGISEVQTRLAALKKHDHCCFVLGLTGSGKSTLICYLCGATLTYTKKNGRYLLSHGDNKKFPEIGNAEKSCTSMTNIY